MGLFRKKADLISDRARALNDEIARLEAQIKQLDSSLQSAPQPRLRSTAVPGGELPSPAANPARVSEPVFVDMEHHALDARTDGASTPAHFNELGVRKYDLPGLWRRVRNHLRGPAASNPKLVSYLAAGGIQGLRPLRYERRVARNRFIVLVGALFLILLGIIFVFFRGH
jgi:hypothetical protein